MQYISSFFGLAGPSAANPNVFLYDSREQATLPVTDMTNANTLARKARTTLGFNGYLNTIRGRKSNKYFLSPLKYTRPRANPIDAQTDIVTQSGTGTLSGMASIAAAQSFVLGLGADTTLFLMQGLQPLSVSGVGAISFPPLTFYDTNCPYGSSATGNMTMRYTTSDNTVAAITASVGGSAPACSSRSYTPTATATLLANSELLQATTAFSVGSGGISGTASVGAGSTSDGGATFQAQTGSDESLVLDKAFFYMNEVRGFIKFDGTDFDPITADPGTRPRIHFRATALLNI